MIGYRSDIDGLRALAVVSVVIYHLNESFLSGGYVGVDLFFVISGYLITQLIVNEIYSTGNFSYQAFYLRRFRRLFPALLANLLLTFCLGYALLSPSHLVEMAESLVAALFSLSNFFFWNEAGYFDTASSTKPLLHTWSLSIEEQFYLVWPMLLVWLCSSKRRLAAPRVIVFIGVISWLLNELFFSQNELVTQFFSNEKDQLLSEVRSTVFYLLPFRVFEFAIGAMLVWTPSLNRRWWGEVLFSLGFGMVLYALITFSSDMEFPSSAALIPCVGAALMIYSGPAHKFNFILSNRIAVTIGLISYSLYLVHWPLIVYLKYRTGKELSGIQIAAVIVLSLLLAYLSYLFIEQPFRRPNKKRHDNQSPNRRFVLVNLVVIFVVVLLSADLIRSKGWLWRYPVELIQ